jgi:N-hydroxyarylamine O-acetyltransferase
LLMVEAGGEQWLADVGFGADGLLQPVPFRPGAICRQYAWQYCVVQEGANFVLRSWRPTGWVDLYAFGLEEQFPIDYEVSNHFTATHPDSTFRKMLLVQRPMPESRLVLANRRLIERTAEGVSEAPAGDDDALLEILRERFGLHFQPGTRFPFEEK